MGCTEENNHSSWRLMDWGSGLYWLVGARIHSSWLLCQVLRSAMALFCLVSWKHGLVGPFCFHGLGLKHNWSEDVIFSFTETRILWATGLRLCSKDNSLLTRIWCAKCLMTKKGSGWIGRRKGHVEEEEFLQGSPWLVSFRGAPWGFISVLLVTCYKSSQHLPWLDHWFNL